MPKKLDEFEFPHGGRKGLDFDFDSLLDGSIWVVERGVDFPSDTTAETFLGSLSRYANQRDLRVNKHISEDGDTVTVRVRPKKSKDAPVVEETTADAPKAAKPKAASAK